MGGAAAAQEQGRGLTWLFPNSASALRVLVGFKGSNVLPGCWRVAGAAGSRHVSIVIYSTWWMWFSKTIRTKNGYSKSPIFFTTFRAPVLQNVGKHYDADAIWITKTWNTMFFNFISGNVWTHNDFVPILIKQHENIMFVWLVSVMLEDPVYVIIDLTDSPGLDVKC